MKKFANITAAAFVLTAFASATFAIAALGQTAGSGYAGGIVSEDGAIRLPVNFRTDYAMLGAWSVTGDADTGGDVALHVVYAPRSAVDGYRANGKFPDGTVLVKELFKGRTEALTTGNATRADTLAGYFVMVKDDIGRFPENALWGDGWGWAFFGAENTQISATKDYRGECLGCHEPARASDFIYIDAYPVLGN